MDFEVFEKEPGVYITESASPPASPAGAATGLAAMAAVTQWGPFGEQLVDSFTAWVKLYGAYISSKYPAYKQVKKYFKNGGQYLYFSRVAHFANGVTTSKAASLKLKDTEATPGDRLTVVAKYDGTLGNKITVDVGPASGGVVGEFKLTVYLDGVAEPAYDNLSLAIDADNYAVSKVNALSGVIKLVDSATNAKPLATTVTGSVLAGGDDGLTSLSTDDYIGSAEYLTGFHAFDVIDDCLLVGCPDEDVNTTVAIRKGVAAWCDLERKRNFQIITVPKGKGATDQIDWYAKTLLLDSPRTALYGPWLKDEDDGEIISPLGAVMGLYARFASDPAKGVWWSPSGLEATLYGFSGVEQKFSPKFAGKLNENRINNIKQISGVGICVWGPRTLAIATAADFKYIGARLNTSDLERRIDKNTLWAVDRPNDSLLWAQIGIVVNSILDARYRAGGLDGESADKAYACVCDKTVNNDTTKAQGLVVAKIGIKNKKTAEFIWFDIAQLNSSATA